jgi:hypothetical protein
MDFYFSIFKIYGITLGFQYINGAIEVFDIDENVRALQLYFFVIGISLEWRV